LSTERSDAIRVAAAARSTDAMARARRAIRELHRRGAEVNLAAVAAIAGVSRQFLYTTPELREEIDKLRGERHTTQSRITAEEDVATADGGAIARVHAAHAGDEGPISGVGGGGGDLGRRAPHAARLARSTVPLATNQRGVRSRSIGAPRHSLGSHSLCRHSEVDLLNPAVLTERMADRDDGTVDVQSVEALVDVVLRYADASVTRGSSLNTATTKPL
jgi:hypothetical protein